jgi:hypothetical protein
MSFIESYGFTLLSAHRKIPIDAKEVLDMIAQKSRKLDNLLYI